MRIGKWIIDNKDEIEFKDDYAVEKDGGETRDVITTYDTTSEVSSWTDFLQNHFTSGTRLGKWFRDFKEGCNFLLHLGSIVNNCTTEDDTAVLSATQGKVLMDLIELQDKTIKEQAEKIDSQETEISDLNNSLMQSGAAAHNAIYRGLYLGSSVTSEQYAAISSGTFDNLYIGDYWTIGGFNWRIAGINYYYNTGSSYNFNTNHLVIVPDTRLYAATMNDSNTTAGGYVGSLMYTTNIADAKSTINSAFGSSHIATHEVYLTTGITDGRPSAGAWSDETVVLMSEMMVYGCPIRMQMSSGGTNYSLTTAEKSQLPLFRYAPQYQNIRSAYWLRDIVSASYFAYVGSYGGANYAYASDSYGVRPAFCLIS